MSAILMTSLLFGLSLPNEEIARRAEANFDRGLQARRQGEPSLVHFRAAAAGFEELRRQGARNAALERNLGNSHFLADDLPRAILAYRRGLGLAPDDRALRASLAEARSHVAHMDGATLGRPPEPRRPPWLPHWPRTLFATSGVVYVVFCLALARWLMLRHKRALALALASLLVAGVASVLSFVVLGDDLPGPVVVIAADGVMLRRGDGEGYPPRFDVRLNRGVEARVLYRRDGWLQIELSGGEVGWVPDRDAVAEE